MQKSDSVMGGQFSPGANAWGDELRKPERRVAQVFRRLLHNRAAAVGLSILCIIVLSAIFAPVIAPYDPIQAEFGESLLPPSIEHIMGTDALGRDIFSRVLYGARISLQLGIISMSIAAFFGTILGLYAGFVGGARDAVIMRGMDIMLAFPSLLLAMGIVAVLGFDLVNTMIAVGIASIPGFTRIVRSSVLTIKQTPYVDAARVTGCNDSRIMLRHILPNAFAPLLVVTTLGVASAIITGAALSFLGLGAQAPTPEWGAMLNYGREWLRSAWWVAVFPGIGIIITVFSINMLGDGLRDALDPRLKV